MIPSTTRLLRGRGSPWRRLIQETRYEGAQTRKQLEIDLRSVRPVKQNIFEAIANLAFGFTLIWWGGRMLTAVERLSISPTP
jgi:hypothetical protein